MRGSERSSNPRPLPDRPGGDEADLARLRNITAGWWKAANYWHLAMNQFAILYEDRFTRPLA